MSLFVNSCSDDPVGPTPTGTVIGTVVDGTTLEPLYEAFVFVQPNDIAQAQSDAQGVFVLNGVEVGNHTLTVQRDRYQGTETTVSVAEGDTTYVEVELSRRPTTSGLVRGFVYSAFDGEPERNAVVAWLVDGDSVSAAVTDQSGFYELPFVSVGVQNFGVLLPEFRPIVDSAEIVVSEAADLNFTAFNAGRFNRASDRLYGYYSFRNNGADDSYANRDISAMKNLQYTTDRLESAHDAGLFDGTAFAECATGSGDFNMLPLSISFWIQTSSTERQCLFSKFKSTENVGFNVGIDNGQLFAHYNSDTARMFVSEISGGTVNTGSWHHVTATFDVSNGIALWLDGTLVAENMWSDTVSNVSVTSGLPLQIGRPSAGDNSMTNFVGALDDIRMYGRALNASQVQLLYSERLQ